MRIGCRGGASLMIDETLLFRNLMSEKKNMKMRGRRRKEKSEKEENYV